MAKYLKFPTQEEFDDLLTRSGVLPNTVPDDEEKLSAGIQNVFGLTLASDQLKLMIEDYLYTHMEPTPGDPDPPSGEELRKAARNLGEAVIILYSQAILIGMLMFEQMLEKALEKRQEEE